jgi:hypothetical protein
MFWRAFTANSNPGINIQWGIRFFIRKAKPKGGITRGSRRERRKQKYMEIQEKKKDFEVLELPFSEASEYRQRVKQLQREFCKPTTNITLDKL